MEKRLSIKWYIKMFSLLPLLFSFFLIYEFSNSVEIHEFFIPSPFYIFYFFQVIFLYLSFVRFTYKLEFYSEYIIIVKGFRRYKIRYIDILEIDIKVIQWLRGQPEYLVIKFNSNNKKVKSFKIEKSTFGKDSIYFIAKYLSEKNMRLNKFVHRFS